MKRQILIEALRRGWHDMFSRKIYLVNLIIVPMAFTFFFTNLMDEGVAMRVPSAVVDLDHSKLSRQMTRTLGSSELVSLESQPTSFHEANAMVRRGDIIGFFLIPEDFQKEAIGGRTPAITYYCNMTYYIPGSLLFKGFKTTAVTTAGGLVQTTLVSSGIPQSTASTLLQPVAVQQNAIANPWMNYNVYLANSFVPGMLALMIVLLTSFSVCIEIKRGTSAEWIRRSGNSMLVALAGKLIPQAVVATCVGVAIQAILFGFLHFPLQNHAMHMILAMLLLVISTQAFAVTVCCILPNPRLAVSICSLMGILAFSIAAFSYPLEQMYPAVSAFGYILPVRYYFLIYIDQALNGIPIYFSRYYYVAMLVFPLVALIGLPRLKRKCLNAVYVP